MRVTPFVITFVTLTAVRSIATPAPEAALPFELFQDSGIIVPVTIDGRGPFRFLLDTGASHSAVSAAVASRLALERTAKTLVTTPVGETWRAVVRVRGLALGRVSAPEIFPSVVDAEALHDGMRVDGVLGQDVLAGLHYTLDYRRRLLSWGDPRSTDRARVRMPLEWIAGCPVVRTAPPGRGSPLRLIADSGASHVVLFDAGHRALPAYERVAGLVRIETLDAQYSARPVLIPELRIGGLVLKDQPAAIVDAGPRGADGVLPLQLFRRVTLNGPDGYVVLEPW